MNTSQCCSHSAVFFISTTVGKSLQYTTHSDSHVCQNPLTSLNHFISWSCLIRAVQSYRRIFVIVVFIIIISFARALHAINQVSPAPYNNLSKKMHDIVLMTKSDIQTHITTVPPPLHHARSTLEDTAACLTDAYP